MDYGYRKEIQVILYNCDVYADYYIQPGDRIAQACFRPIPQVSMTYVDQISEEISLDSLPAEGSSLADEMKAKLLKKRGGLGSTGDQ